MKIFYYSTIGLFLLSVCELSVATALRDPTQPPHVSRSADVTMGLQLASILRGPDRRMALINGQWLQEGDDIAGMVVQRITENRVVMKNGTRTVALTLVPQVMQARVS